MFELIIVGFFIIYVIGIVIDKKTKWIDGKKEADDYMEKKYGKCWWKLK